MLVVVCECCFVRNSPWNYFRSGAAVPLALCALSISHSHSCIHKYSGIIINAIRMHTPSGFERKILFSTFFFHTIAMFNRISSILCINLWLSVCGSEKMFLFLALLHGLVPLFIAYQRLFLPNELRAHNVKLAWNIRETMVCAMSWMGCTEYYYLLLFICAIFIWNIHARREIFHWLWLFYFVTLALWRWNDLVGTQVKEWKQTKVNDWFRDWSRDRQP